MTSDEAQAQLASERLEAQLEGSNPDMVEARWIVKLEELEAEERAERDLPRLEAEERAARPAAERREAWLGHNTAASEFELIAERMGAKVPERRKKIARTLAKYPPGKVPAGEFSEVREEAAKLLAEDAAGRKAGKLAERERGEAARFTVKEAGPYEKGSPHSWVRDVLATRGQEVQSTAGSLMDPESVRERLSHHGKDIRVAVRERSKFGERARATIHEHLRCEDERQHERKAREWRLQELRAFGTDGGISATSPGEAASFVPPLVLLKSWSGWRTPYASFANQCQQMDMPAYGLNLYVPHVTGATEVTSQTEGSAVAEKAPTAGLIKSAVVTKSGGVEVSQQFLDRVGPGIAGDQVLFQQLKGEIDTAVDLYALEAALKEAQTVTNSAGSFTFGETSGSAGVGSGFLNDIRKAKNALATLAGTRLKATHMFAPSQFVNFIEAYGTTIGGPIWTPAFDDNRLAIRAEGDMQGEGYSGYLLNQLAVFSDDSIPLHGTGSFYQVVVADPATVLVFRSPPVFSCFPETYSTTLDAELTARCYTACVPRWPEGTASVTGGMYHSTLFA